MLKAVLNSPAHVSRQSWVHSFDDSSDDFPISSLFSNMGMKGSDWLKLMSAPCKILHVSKEKYCLQMEGIHNMGAEAKKCWGITLALTLEMAGWGRDTLVWKDVNVAELDVDVWVLSRLWIWALTAWMEFVRNFSVYVKAISDELEAVFG